MKILIALKGTDVLSTSEFHILKQFFTFNMFNTRVQNENTKGTLPYKVKTQYVHLLSTTGTSIKRIISHQSTHMEENCIYMFDIVNSILPLVIKEN